jgi:starch phosphorylase
LDELKALAVDLTWTWEPRIQELFATLDPGLWEESGHNPIILLAKLGPEGVAAARERPEVQRALLLAEMAAGAYRAQQPAFYDARAPLLVGYFSLEFGIAECLPIYSGGLGILAGDHLKAASDLGMPLVAVGVFYREGFGRQRINEANEQTEIYPENIPDHLPITRVEVDGKPLIIEAPIGTETVKIGVWEAKVGRVPLYLLDTNVDGNSDEFRNITDRLYAPEPDRRLRQEIVLGIGGMRALRAIGIEPTVYHMNEGHGFLVGTERIRELRSSRQITLSEARLVARAGIVFTTHTPVAAGSDYFDSGLVWELLGPYLSETGISFDRFMDLGRAHPGDPREQLCTTYVGLRMSDVPVGVSRLHGTVSRRLWKDAWPGLPESQVPIGSVTNGVHMATWLAPEIIRLFADYVGDDWWTLDADDSAWSLLDGITPKQLWDAHQDLRHRLVRFARTRTHDADQLDPEALTIGFSRRFAPYKRATLLLSDPQRLKTILAKADRPIQFVFSGKSHPADMGGKAILKEVVTISRQEPWLVFLEDYDIEVARHVVQGADVWLNNPKRFIEASGTSGMKAGANGVLNLSILDGWWDEAYTSNLGWAIPSGATLDRPDVDDEAEADALYRLLEKEVIPTFYDRDEDGIPQRWVEMMMQSVKSISTQFSARRMVLDYFKDAYAPAARRVEQLRLLPDWGG